MVEHRLHVGRILLECKIPKLLPGSGPTMVGAEQAVLSAKHIDLPDTGGGGRASPRTARNMQMHRTHVLTNPLSGARRRLV